MLMFAGISAEDAAQRKSLRDNVTLMIRFLDNGTEIPVADMIGKTIKIIREPLAGNLLIELVED